MRIIAARAAGRLKSAGHTRSAHANTSKNTDSSAGGRRVSAFASAMSAASAFSPWCWMLLGLALAKVSSGV